MNENDHFLTAYFFKGSNNGIGNSLEIELASLKVGLYISNNRGKTRKTMRENYYHINEELVRRLIWSQFPKFKELSIVPVAKGGWDNRTFHLGKHLIIRMLSAEEYALQVEKEQYWLPKLGPLLPLKIPKPIALGLPDFGYPWKWSIYEWIEGDTLASTQIQNYNTLAQGLARFLKALQKIDSKGGPEPGLHSFFRGGSLSVYDQETKKALKVLQKKIDTKIASTLWNKALRTSWKRPPVWIHGDISAGNLLVKDGKLCAVIDFGQLAVGDPACDLSIAWTLFDDEARAVFKEELHLDDDTWLRGLAWTLWKALIVLAGFTNPDNAESYRCFSVIEDVLRSYKNFFA